MKCIRAIFFLSILCLSVASTYAQSDTLPLRGAEKEITINPNRLSARKATLMSAALPGLGQAYTKSYWKIPIIYVGAGIIGYLLIDNSQKYVVWRDRYIIQRTAIENGFEPPVINENRGEAFRLETLKLAKDTYRRYRDLNVILAGLLYVLNIADANVTAHLKTFDLSKDLSMTIQPGLVPTPYMQPGAGISLRLTLK
jgi:hypothetical protein